LKTYFQIRKNAGEIFNDKTPLFLSNLTRNGKHERLNENSVRTVFTRLKQKIGIVVSPHRIRKLFSSYMVLKVRHPAVLKYWMGHSVETSDIEGRYVLPPLEEQRKLYMESYDQIDIKPKVTISKEELRQELIDTLPDQFIEPLAKAHGLSVSEYKRAAREKRIAFGNERLESEREPKKKTKTETNGGKRASDCINGNCCTQKIVSEDELPQLLADGWTFVATLPSGKCVVSNETS
jgi:hypothetical protein